MIKTVSLLVHNQNTVLPRVCNLFARRSVPILSLTSALTEEPKISRLTIVVDSGNHLVEHLQQQLSSLVEVIEVAVLDRETMISWELMLLKITATVKTRQDILTICELTKASVVDISPTSLTMQASGSSDFLDTIVAMLRPYDIIEVVRTGTVALQKGSLGISIPRSQKEQEEVLY